MSKESSRVSLTQGDLIAFTPEGVDYAVTQDFYVRTDDIYEVLATRLADGEILIGSVAGSNLILLSPEELVSHLITKIDNPRFDFGSR